MPRLAILMLLLPGVSWSAPGEGVPLTHTQGTVHHVATVGELQAALSAANAADDPDTILLADGVYTISSNLHVTGDSLLVRSESGDRDAVVIRGPDEGPSATLGNVFLVSADHFTLADVTVGWCRWHGVQAQGENPHDVDGLWIHNCRFANCNEQFIKGSSAEGDPVGLTGGIIEQSLFEFTSGWAYQYYTGGIDIHKGVDWIVRDNLFRNIRTPEGGGYPAEHAIHFWKRASMDQNVTAERNWVINCDRGIGFGLSNADGGFRGGSSVIRDNLVSNDGSGPFTDVGIGLEYADHVQVLFNTVVVPNYWAPMEYRFPGTVEIHYHGNLTDKEIRQRDGASATFGTNLESVGEDWFVDQAGGDLRLAAPASPAIDQLVAEVGTVDVDRWPRPVADLADLGAHEYRPGAVFADGFEFEATGWWSTTVP
jgi:hypothetical protein